MFAKLHILFAIAASLICLTASSSARAEWVLLDDYESYTDGQSLHNVNGWQYLDTITSGSWVVQDHTGQNNPSKAAADPLNSNNMAFGMACKIVSGSTYGRGAIKSLGDDEIAYGTTSTIHVRAMIPTNNEANCLQFGTIGASTKGYSSLASQVLFYQPNTTDDICLIVRSGTQELKVISETSGTLVNDKWYDFWMVIDNANLNYDVYYSADGGAAVSVATDCVFRKNPSSGGSIHSFVTFSSKGENTYDYIDDVYISEGTNLTIPVPEPSALVLGMMGLIGLVCYAWQKRK